MTQTSRERMLARIREGLASAGPLMERAAAAAPHTAPPFVHPAQEDLVEQFATEIARLECIPHRCADDEDALEAIAGILERSGASEIIAWDLEQVGLPGLAGLLAQRGVTVHDGHVTGARRAAALQELEPVPVCLTGAEAGVAESATIIVRSGAGRPRLASLLAPAYIAVLRREQIARGLGEALARIRARHGDALLADASSLVFVTGPSRTADIELTLTLGVHGPRDVHVVLVG
jgi:L-lactate dehydrogenase complex protein LldG